MTTDRTARPASTPAPVAVPEEPTLAQMIEAYIKVLEDLGPEHSEHSSCARCATLAEVLAHLRSLLAPRPEPVVAPLPSEAVDGLAEVVWTASRADESTISVTGAQHVARAVIAAGYRPPSPPSEAADDAEDALIDDLHNCLNAHLSWRDGDDDGSEHWVEAPVTEVAKAVIDAGYRLAPEDDEDTVRVSCGCGYSGFGGGHRDDCPAKDGTR